VIDEPEGRTQARHPHDPRSPQHRGGRTL